MILIFFCVCPRLVVKTKYIDTFIKLFTLFTLLKQWGEKSILALP